MKLKELFDIIKSISDENNMSECFIVGGTPRDKVLGTLANMNDIDLTNGDKSISILAKELSIKLKKYDITTRTMDDGHTSIFLGDLKFDFSSNFNVPNIEKVLYHLGIKNPTEMEKEIYSRDFTCNSLLLTLDLKNITDITKAGISDINKKIIKTCLEPDLTLRYNLNRILRTIYLSAKLDFDVEENIISWISKNKELIKEIPQSYCSKQINKALSFNPERTVFLINKMNIWDYIPITEELYPYFKSNSLNKTSQLFTNFDYADLSSGPGKGLYSQMDKFKSVDEFRKKRRKRRKKIIKQIKNMKFK